MTNQKQWWDEFRSTFPLLFTHANEQGRQITQRVEDFIAKVAQKEYERGLKESNSGRIMYEKGKQDGVRECVEILREIHNKLCDEQNPAALQTLKVLEGLSKLTKEQ